MKVSRELLTVIPVSSLYISAKSRLLYHLAVCGFALALINGFAAIVISLHSWSRFVPPIFFGTYDMKIDATNKALALLCLRAGKLVREVARLCRVSLNSVIENTQRLT